MTRSPNVVEFFDGPMQGQVMQLPDGCHVWKIAKPPSVPMLAPEPPDDAAYLHAQTGEYKRISGTEFF